MINEFSAEVLSFFDQHLKSDLANLALKASPFSDIDNRALIEQLQGLQIAQRKFPSFLKYPQLKYPPKISLEQSSSEACARFKSSLIDGNSFADLTGGFGVDCYWLGQKFDAIHYVEPRENLQVLAQRNFSILGLENVNYYEKNAESFLDEFAGRLDWIYLDPSRRNASRRKIDLKGYEPNVIELQDQLLRAGKKIMLKLSPMQDVSDLINQLSYVRHVYICEWQKELKELLILIDPDSLQQETQIHLVQLDGPLNIFTGKFQETKRSINFSAIDNYIFEPGPALQKSGLINYFAVQNQLSKVQANSQILTASNLFKNSLGKSFRVLVKTNLKVQNILPHLKQKMANVIVRNFPIKAEAIKKKLNIKEGGDQYLIATTDHMNKRCILICERIN